MQKFILTLLLVLFVFSGLAHAVSYRFSNADPDSDAWSVAQNWLPVGIPGTLDVAAFNYAGAAGTLYGDAGTIDSLKIGDNEPGHLTIARGGRLVISPDYWAAVGYNSTASLTIEAGGSLVSGTRFHVGLFDDLADQNDALFLDGYMEINAEFDLGHEFDGLDSTGAPYAGLVSTAVVNGTLDVDTFNIHANNCRMDLRDGTIIIDGDQTDKISGYVSDGRLVAFDGDETIVIDITANPGRTTVTSTKPVDAGKDMITWSGEPVVLDATVRGGGSYAWSADPDDRVVFSDDTVEDPNVTITKPDPGLILTTITIDNSGFENPSLAEGSWTSTPPAWTNGHYDVTSPTVWVVVDSGAGVYNPTVADGYGGVAAEGDNLMAATSGAGFDKGMNQVLSDKLQANTQYDLSVLVGNPSLFNLARNGSAATADYRIELLAGGVVVASDTGPSPLDHTTSFITASLTYNSGDSPAQLGKTLEIRLLAADFTDGYGVDFDDVKLTATNPTPDLYTVTLTLTVNGVNKDSLTIDVYDDACKAAIANGLAADNAGDFNKNCITDPNDLAELATKWLTGYTIPEPVIKP